VVGVELRRWRRHRLAVVSALVLPAAVAALASVALGGDAPALRLTFAVVDHERGVASRAFVEEALGAPPVAEIVDVRPTASEAEARRLVDADEADALIVLPPGLATRLTPGAAEAGEGERTGKGVRTGEAGGGAAGIEVVAGDPLAGDIAAMVVDQYVTRARTMAVAQAATGRAPAGPWPLAVELRAPGGRPLDAARHYGPGAGLFFVLVGAGFAAQRAVADRRRGLVDRLATTPAAPVMVAAGRAVAALGVGGLSLATTAAVMHLLFGRGWGPPLAVAAVGAASVVALAGVAAVVAALSRTPEQAAVLSTGVAFVFALASGLLSPPGSIGERSALAPLVPTTYASEAFGLLATDPAAGLGAVAGPVAALCSFGVAGGLATALLGRRAA
jgi:hypothetical protein